MANIDQEKADLRTVIAGRIMEIFELGSAVGAYPAMCMIRRLCVGTSRAQLREHRTRIETLLEELRDEIIEEEQR